MTRQLAIIFIKIGVISFFLLPAACQKNSAGSTPKTVTVAPPVIPVTVADTSLANYTLVWSDEFNGTAVDTTKWTFETGNPGVNNEREYYQAANAAVAGGSLIITAKKQTVGNFLYTSARMNTLNKVSAQYGRVEARIKLPLGTGLWPAFWMLGTDITSLSWPQCGEIDIMEHVNDDNVIHGTMHWNNNGHAQYGLSTTTTPADFHVYTIFWDSSSIRWYVDNALYLTGNIANNINNTGAFQFPFYLLLNMAVAGDFPGQTVDESKLPASMYVDYVRVYKAK